MVYEVSLYDVRKNTSALIKHSYWKRNTFYKGKHIIIRDYPKGKIIKYIDLIQQ